MQSPPTPRFQGFLGNVQYGTNYPPPVDQPGKFFGPPEPVKKPKPQTPITQPIAQPAQPPVSQPAQPIAPQPGGFPGGLPMNAGQQPTQPNGQNFFRAAPTRTVQGLK